MKKYLMASFFVLIMILMLTACGGTKTSNKQEIAPEVEFVLNRELYLFKDLDAPYADELKNSVSYAKNWTFREVLNEENFDNIEWTVNSHDDAKYVIFCGLTKEKEMLGIEYMIIEGAKAPLIISAILNTDDEKIEVSAEDYINLGIDAYKAQILVDALAVTLAVSASSQASVNY